MSSQDDEFYEAEDFGEVMAIDRMEDDDALSHNFNASRSGAATTSASMAASAPSASGSVATQSVNYGTSVENIGTEGSDSTTGMGMDQPSASVFSYYSASTSDAVNSYDASNNFASAASSHAFQSSNTSATGTTATAVGDSASATSPISTPPMKSDPPNTTDSATEKRRAIQAILRDTTLSDLDRRLKIQRLMDGSSHTNQSNGGQGTQRAYGCQLGQGDLATLRSPGGLSSLISGIGAAGASAASGASSLAAALLPNIGRAAESGAGGEEGDGEVVACVHYERKCNVVAPCCGVVFGCRVCHDEINSGCGPMDRFAIKEIVCKECGTRQSSGTNSCKKCKVTFAEYHCPKCNIWMSLKKQPFHCGICGFCRVGGRENFRHCVQCCMCIAVSVYETHNCMKDKYKNNCPVCREDMFSSRQSPQDLPCGHAIHAHCFRNLASFDYRCPICKKTVVSRNSMSAAWEARARDIQMQPMPEDLARVVNIMCNDCELKSLNRDWHFLGVQCPRCQSFNTVVEQVVSAGSGSGGVESNGE